MQTNTIMRYQFTLFRMTVIKKTTKTSDVEKKQL